MTVAAQSPHFIRRPRLHRIAIAQLAVALLVAALSAFWSVIAAYSALLGGLICFLPSAYFMIRVFQYQGARSASRVVANFYKAEAHKFLLVVVLFGVVLKYVDPLEPVALFVGFISVQVVHAFSGILAKL